MHNRRMLEMKANMQVYNYVVKHIKGVKNFNADQLSRRPTWLVDKDDKETDYEFGQDLDIEEGALSAILSVADGDAGTDYAMRTMVSVKQLLKDNPALKDLEQMGMKLIQYTYTYSPKVKQE